MKKIFYEKVGRKYVPIAEYDNEYMSSFSKGAHLVMCVPGGQSRRHNIDPNYAAMIAAGIVAQEGITRAIHRASALKSGTERLALLPYSSARDLAAAGMNAMMIEADKLMTNPAVRKAYEQFIFLAKLTKTQK